MVVRQTGQGRSMGEKDTHDSDVSFIRALAEMLRANDLTEIQVKRDYGGDDSINVRVSRGPVASAQPQVALLPAATMTASLSAPAEPSDGGDPASHPGAVTSPMVGTVYLQGEPGVPPFAVVGQSVKVGDTLLIIEAMKTMNQIPSPHAGIVKRILIEDGAPVEYGAPLMIIE